MIEYPNHNYFLAGGAWLVAHTAEQRRRFKAVLCTKPVRTFSQIREERKRAEKTGSSIIPPTQDGYSDEEEEKPLDGFFLVHNNLMHCGKVQCESFLWCLKYFSFNLA